MKIRVRYLVLLLALSSAPTLASAQRGGGGRGGSRNGDSEGKSIRSAPELPSGSDIDKLDPRTRAVVAREVLPEQERTHESLSALKHSFH